MGSLASLITSLTSVYSTFHSGADQRKHQSSASLAFVRGTHRRPVNSTHKWPVTRKMFPLDDVIMCIWKRRQENVGYPGPVLKCLWMALSLLSLLLSDSRVYPMVHFILDPTYISGHVRTVSANERRRYICNVCSHRLRPFSCDLRSWIGSGLQPNWNLIYYMLNIRCRSNKCADSSSACPDRQRK